MVEKWRIEARNTAGTLRSRLEHEVESIQWSYSRIGGCGPFSFTIRRPFNDTGGITADWDIRIYRERPQRNVPDYGILFDGTSGANVTISDDADNRNIFDTDGGTVEALVKAASDGLGSLGRIADKTDWVLNLQDEAGGFVRPRFQKLFSSNDGDWEVSSLDMAVNSIHHIGLSYDADATTNDPKFYLNGFSRGVTETTAPTGTTDSDSGQSLLVGNNAATNAAFDGMIDELRLYKPALTGREIFEHKNNNFQNPMIRTELDGASGSLVVSDATAIQNIFDGGGTFECWFYPRSAGELNLGTLYNKGDVISILQTNVSGGTSKLTLNKAFSGTSGSWVTTTFAITFGRWYHLLVHYDDDAVGNNPTIYLDGTFIAVTESTTPVGTRTTDVGSDLYLCNRADDALTVDGLVESIRLYDGLLSGPAMLEHRQGDFTRNVSGIKFDGSSGDITVADASAIQDIFDGGGSFECWVYTESAGEINLGTMLNKGDVISFHQTNVSGATTKLGFNKGFSGTGGSWVTTNVVITDFQWHHVVVTYDADDVGNNPIIYVNGVAVAVTESVTPVGTRTTDVGSDLYLGNRSDDALTLDGTLAGVRFYSDVLTPTEVNEHMNGLYVEESSLALHLPMSRTDGDTSTTTVEDSTDDGNDGVRTGATWTAITELGIWAMDSGSGDTAFDTSGNNNHGTLQGDAVFTQSALLLHHGNPDGSGTTTTDLGPNNLDGTLTGNAAWTGGLLGCSSLETGVFDLYYRGIVMDVKQDHKIKDGVIISGDGYAQQLSRVLITKTYSVTLVHSIVADIMDNQGVGSKTSIVTSPENITASSLTAQTIVFNNTPAATALTQLAELSGAQEWGVGRDAGFFFHKRQDVLTSTRDDIQHFDLGNNVTGFSSSDRYREIVNAAYVEGAQISGTTIITESVNSQSQVNFGRRERRISAAELVNSVDCAALGDAIVAELKDPRQEIAFTLDIGAQPLMVESRATVGGTNVSQLLRFVTTTIKYGQQKYGTFRYSGRRKYHLVRAQYSVTTGPHQIQINAGEAGRTAGNFAALVNEEVGNIRQRGL